MIRSYERRKEEGKARTAVGRYLRQLNFRLKCKLLGIGDGANDVAMIQEADVGVGVAGKEGRQAVNNSDYSIAQFKYLARLILVHGQCNAYRLANLIKFSFMKNIAFGFIMFYF